MITKLMIVVVVILFIMGTGCLILDQQDKNRKLEKQNNKKGNNQCDYIIH